MADDCVFCKIVRGEIPCKKVHETDRLLVFHDAYPQAKMHLLVIPKEHFQSVIDLHPGRMDLLQEMFTTGVEIARKEMPSGFRSVINTLGGGGQTVFHLHLHLIGGSTVSPRFA